MAGQELKQHLTQLEEQLAILMNSYKDYKSRNIQNEQVNISLLQHILYVMAIISITILSTYVISSFLIEVKDYMLSIAVVQALLSIGVYIYFAKKLINVPKKPQPKTTSNKSVFELDQQRFAILQELARSPIPQSYITPTAIKKMLQLVNSGKCLTIDECLAQINLQQEKHKEELKLIQNLQMISFH
ncbi:hypothetical protein [Metabacillus sediminilitoris]|uniref:Uncharacterized protein n=1 Tax=Metabacillus sediminilitoris TaxID=2567941 RepID=A0A4S4C1S2_9BACI|nr:hypothetical protein [Metabacillus sediminilitoris]QGQ48181.1 hypothetical protein GMB29_24715 [Metabacillus sediminilitoris]THF81458.1 hypothetical protein E6W99_05995 [Metabacillus sediminilitoris]